VAWFVVRCRSFFLADTCRLHQSTCGPVENIVGVKLRRKYHLNAPKGVNGRNSDNTLIKKLLNWEPSIPLPTGLERTYAWIYDQCMAREREQRLHQRKLDNTLLKAASSFLPGAA